MWIGIGDFSVVEMACISPRTGRRFVGSRIVKVDPDEVSPRGAVEPGLSVLDNFLPRPLDAAPAPVIPAVGAPAVGLGEVIVEIEAAIEAGGERVAIENDGSDETRRLVAVFFNSSAAVMLGRERDAKSVTPCTLGKRPVRIVMCEVFVIGLWVKAWVKRTPSAASVSSAGVSTCLYP